MVRHFSHILLEFLNDIKKTLLSQENQAAGSARQLHNSRWQNWLQWTPHFVCFVSASFMGASSLTVVASLWLHSVSTAVPPLHVILRLTPTLDHFVIFKSTYTHLEKSPAKGKLTYVVTLVHLSLVSSQTEQVSQF